MNKEEAFEFISRMDWMHPKMKQACKVIEQELSKKSLNRDEIIDIADKYIGMKPEDFGVNSYAGLSELFTLEILKLQNPNQEPPILKGRDKPILEFWLGEFEKNLEKAFDKASKEVFEEILNEYEQGGIAENKHSCTDNEPLFIDVPIDENSKITKHESDCHGVKYWFGVGTATLLIYKEHCNNCYYHSGGLIKGEMNSIIDKIVQDYEEGLAKEEEKKDEPEGTLFLADDLKVFGVSYDHENKCVIYSYFNRGEFEKVTRHSNGEFTYKGIKLGATTTNKLKDSILDYWTNVINK